MKKMQPLFIRSELKTPPQHKKVSWLQKSKWCQDTQALTTKMSSQHIQVAPPLEKEGIAASSKFYDWVIVT